MAEFLEAATRRVVDRPSRNAAPQVQGGATDQSSPESQTARRFASHWVGGERLPAEEFLARCGGKIDEKIALRVIYEEICLRQDSGENVDSKEYFERFPQWRDELNLLFECQGLLEFGEPRYPAAGDRFDEFLLENEIGRGGQGRVFLATQPELADRQVVLKLSPQQGAEHLSLARVLHTNIVPLYFARDDHSRNLRIFCMPFLGRMSLAHLLTALRDVPQPDRNGQAIVALLEPSGPTSGARSTTESRFLAQATYIEAVCRIGAAIADGLHYVHERGLVHLDVKPSNVLITADVVPMLLDFHLTREPVPADAPPPEWFGGTPDYMSPEQKLALESVRNRQPLSMAVDARADVFSLGQVLYESLLGVHTEGVAGENLPLLNIVAPEVSIGLSDVVAKCLAADPNKRYQTAGELAADLRRHLAHLPLVGVPNRHLGERWSKWRRRSPSGLAVAFLSGLAVVAALAAVVIGWRSVSMQSAEANRALMTGERFEAAGRHDEAADEYARGREIAEDTPGASGLAAVLAVRAEHARRRRQIDALHALVDRLRFIYGQDTLSPLVQDELHERCRTAWQARSSLDAAVGGDPVLASVVRADLLDLAVLWSHVVARSQKPADLAQASEILDEAEHTLGGGGLVLTLEHELVRIAQLNPAAAATARAAVVGKALAVANGRDPQLTSWDYQAVGRCLVRLGQVGAAARCFQTAVELSPDDFWANFFQGDAAWRRGDLGEAMSALRVCVSLAPNKAACYYNRGLVQAARKNWDQARRDFDRAATLDPKLGPAFLERGLAERGLGRLDAALSDFDLALKSGADPAVAHTAAAQIYLARHDRQAAARAARLALESNARYAPALEIQAALRGQ